MIIIIGTFGQALSGEAHAVNIVGVLIVWRVLVSVNLEFHLPAADSHLDGRWNRR